MTKLNCILMLTLVSFLAACGGASNGNTSNYNPPPPAPDTISGTVTFKGSPLPGARVTNFITNSNAVYAVATTDTNGNYSFSGMQTTGDVAGEYQIFVTKAGYGFYPSTGQGAKVMRADYTGQFQGNGVTDIAIYFTVIDFVALPAGSVSQAEFKAYNGTNPLVTLAATGQQASYANGDDGAMKKGVALSGGARFTNNQDGTVTDNLTGLIWLRDAGCTSLSPAVWATALEEMNQLASGNCELTDGSTAGQWRMPNLNELESVIDVSMSGPALPLGNPFSGVSDGIYWTSTSYFGGEGGSPKAWTIRLGDGRYMNDITSNVKASSVNAVWAVKGRAAGPASVQATGMYVPYASGDDGSLQMGVPLTSPRWIDNGNGTLTDTMTGLVWLKQANCIQGTWTQTLASIGNLASGSCGLSDGSSAGSWRMPNRNEMQSLSDRMETNLADYFNQTYIWKSDGSLYQLPIFTNFIEGQYYWTSTTDAYDTTEAWTVFSCDYGVYDVLKSDASYTLAVRDLGSSKAGSQRR